MNVLKNFEALFVVTLGLACAANYVLDETTASPAPVQASYTAPASKDMQVIVVSAKRLSAEEKKQSLIDEGKSVLAADTTAASKI